MKNITKTFIFLTAFVLCFITCDTPTNKNKKTTEEGTLFVYAGAASSLEIANDSRGYTFPDTFLNESDEISITLKNTGNGIINLTGKPYIKLDGATAVFSISAPPEASAINKGESVSFKIKFTPLNAVESYVYVSIPNNSKNEPDFSFTVYGKGMRPKPIATILYNDNPIPQNGPINAGEVILTQPMNITVIIKNTGREVLTIETDNISISGTEKEAFIIKDPPAQYISPGNQSQLIIECNPNKQGGNNATLRIPTNDSSRLQMEVYLQAQAVKGSAVLKLTQGSTIIANNSLTPFDFERVDLGTDRALVFTIENTGNIPLELTGNPTVESSNATFSVSIQPSNKTLIPKDTTSFIIKYIPTAEGENTGNITITNNSDAMVFILNVKGTGYEKKPQISVFYNNIEILQNGTIDVGDVLITQSRNIQVYIKNTGDAPLNIDTANIKITGADSAVFSKITDPINNISVDNQTSFIIDYSPIKQGDNGATLTIPTNDNFRNPVIIYLQARGRISCNVTFNINNGNGTVPDTQIVPVGSSIILPGGNGFSRTWYTFGGWNTSADGTGANYNVLASFTPINDITLYAKWNIVSYTITYSVNDGNGTIPNSQTVNAGTNITLPNNSGFSRNGYAFSGWNTEPLGTGNNYNDYYLVTGNITLYAKWELITNIPGANLAAKLNWLHSNAVSGVSYTIEVNADEKIEPQTLSYGDRDNISITLKGIGTERIISLLSNGSLFTVESGITLVLNENISLQGHNTNNNRLVQINQNGTLIMNTGTKIFGNTGGGVYIADSTLLDRTYGTFIMNGGIISGNTASKGGGVYVGGTFTMSGGTISGNTATSFVSMSKSAIPPPKVEGEGGGVYIDAGIFNKTGGTIFGYNSTNNNSNVTKNESGTVSSNKGHAVYARKYVTIGSVKPSLVEDTVKRKETDAAQSINLYFSGSTNPSTYSGKWDY